MSIPYYSEKRLIVWDERRPATMFENSITQWTSSNQYLNHKGHRLPTHLENQEWRTNVKVLKSNTPNTSVDTFIYLRLTWWGRDCDHWTKPLLTKKSEDDILKEYRLILNFHKNDRILQVRISFSGKYFWYMCIAK